MKMRTLALAAVAAALCLSNCGRDKSVTPEHRNIEKRLTRAGHTVYYYDTHGRVSFISAPRPYTGSMIPGIRSLELFYENDRLVRQDILEGGGGKSFPAGYTYEYDSDGFLRDVACFYGDRDGTYTEPFHWRIRCDSLGRPVSVDWLRRDGTISPYQMITFDPDGNILELRTDFSSGVARTVLTYQYDRCRNPFSIERGIMEAFGAYNRNNPLKIIQDSSEPGVDLRAIMEFEYEYDESGYPVHSWNYQDGELVGETVFEYEPTP
jgi:hypothetical protein